MNNYRKVLIVVAILGLPLFFINGSTDDALRSYKHVWDLGHIIIFFFWTFLFITTSKKIGETPLFSQLLKILAIAFILGVAIELLQSQTDRTGSVRDLLNDLLGTLIAISFLSPSLKKVSNRIKKSFQLALLILFFYSLYPLLTSLIDEASANKNFPILSNFENYFEITRWEGKTDFERTSEIVNDGNFSLKVPLTTSKYSGITLKYFPGNWNGYEYLLLSIFNPLPAPLIINCKINDSLHKKRGYKYEDRYNGQHTLQQGWNDIKISLIEVLNAPQDRQMDLSRITTFQFFVSSLYKERLIYIDDIRLE